MPISINNSLPSIHLHVGTIVDDKSKMRILVDISATMSKGNKAYH